MRDYIGKKFSVLGDSVSTFKGYTDEAGVFYGRAMCLKGGLSGVEDTWWMQVINGLGGVLEKNDSFAGSTVSGDVGHGDPVKARAGRLGAPDVIFVCMGANDAAFGVSPKDFAVAYGEMLDRLRENYPEAEIWCATFMRGRLADPEGELFFTAGREVPRAEYCDVVRRVAPDHGCRVADLAASGAVYDAIDGAHPNLDGMTLIAKLWLAEMQK